jgi:hypothetical protein
MILNMKPDSNDTPKILLFYSKYYFHQIWTDYQIKFSVDSCLKQTQNLDNHESICWQNLDKNKVREISEKNYGSQDSPELNLLL